MVPRVGIPVGMDLQLGKTKEGGQSKKKMETPKDGRQKSCQNIRNPHQMKDNKARRILWVLKLTWKSLRDFPVFGKVPPGLSGFQKSPSGTFRFSEKSFRDFPVFGTGRSLCIFVSNSLCMHPPGNFRFSETSVRQSPSGTFRFPEKSLQDFPVGFGTVGIL